MWELSEEEFNSTPEKIRKDLVKGEDGKYRTADNDALKKAKDREKQEKDALKTQYEQAQAKLTEYEKQQQEAKEKGLADKGEWTKLQEEYAKKLSEIQAGFEAEKQTYSKTIHDLTVGTIAKNLAKEIATVPDLISGMIAERLDYIDGKVMVKDREGKPSAASIDDLKKEFLLREDLKPIMIANAASGSGSTTPPSKTNGNGGSNPNVDYMRMSPKELAQQIKSKH